MSTATRVEPYTFDDFCALVKEHEKGDLIDGVIYMASPENTDANKMMKWLGALMHLYVEQKILGEIFLTRVAFQLDDFNGPEPDIGFVATRHLDRVKRGRVHGVPDVAVEIVSTDSVERDYTKKRAQYERFGVSEYWIIDEIEQKVTLLRLNPKGKYREVRSKSGRFLSEAILGFWFRAEWLWPATRPATLEALNQILAAE